MKGKKEITNENAVADRKLINEDLNKLDKIISQIKRLYAPINEMALAYEGLKIGEFNNEIYLQIINNGLTEIKKAYDASIEKMLDNLGIHIQAVRDNFKAGTQEAMKKLEAARVKVETAPYASQQGFNTLNIIVPLDMITIEDGKPCITEEIKERILETYCRVYIQPGIETEMYNALETLAASVNDLIKITEQIKYAPYIYFSGFGFLSQFLNLDLGHDKKVTPNPDIIHWAIAYVERAKKNGSGR